MSPPPEAGDSRIQTVDYDAGRIVQLQGAPGYQLTVELSPDEQVQNVAVGDSSAWQVSVNRSGDHLFLKPTQSDVATNMTVITSVRVYNFDLVPLAGPSPDMAYTVRFRYPQPVATAVATEQFLPAHLPANYKLSGDRSLRPSSVRDDGRTIYVSWPSDRPFPAVYAVRDTGEEVLVDAMVRDDVMVIDGIARRLVFRIDNRVATAVRVVRRRARS
jgi:type IV secretion system protein VirB9